MDNSNTNGLRSWWASGNPNVYGDIFADVFGAFKVKWPILYYLSEDNRPGVLVEKYGRNDVSVIYLGRPYSFSEIVAAISHVLSSQDLKCHRPWFIERMQELGLDISDPSYSSFTSD